MTLRTTHLRLVLPWVLLTAVVTYFVYQQSYDNDLAVLTQKHENIIAEASANLYRSLGSLSRDTLFLANHPLTREAVSDETISSRVKLETRFSYFSESAQSYDQIRWLDEQGHEAIRINLIDGKAKAVSDQYLQDKNDRYYVKEGFKKVYGEVYFSPLDLNVEAGEIERPYKPIIRSVTPVQDQSGHHKGLIVLNFKAKPILDALQELGSRANLELTLLNSEGYWLVPPPQQQPWAFMFDMPQERLSVSNPNSWVKISANNAGSFINSKGYWHFQRINLPWSGSEVRYWYLVVHSDRATLNHVRSRALYTCAGVALLLILMSGYFSWHTLSISAARDRARANLELKKLELEQSNHALAYSLDTLQKTQADLIETGKLSSLGMMVAGVAHELNTPIGAALMTISSLEHDSTQLEQAFKTGLKRSDVDVYFQQFHQGATLLKKNLDRAALLVHSFKQLAVDRTSEEKRTFKLRELIDDLLSTTWLKLKKESHTLEVDVPDDLELTSFPGALGQVLENLVNNALKHAFLHKNHGRIILQAEQLNDEDNTVVIMISDNGEGIAEEVMNKVFDPFFTTARGRGGTGLGMHLVQQLVSRVLQGTIKLESTLGEGTTVTVQLPRMAQA